MKAQYFLPYGKSQIAFHLPKGSEVVLIRPKPFPPAPDAVSEIERALDEPIGSSRLEDLRKGEKICIVISDLTRPLPNRLILPILLKRLDIEGVPRRSITILIATGQHPKVVPDQLHQLVDPAWTEGIEVICHDPSENLIHLGQTSRGTPLWINRTFLKSDFRILTGMIDPHQFVGFTGGSKMASIGLGGLLTIEANHSMLTHPNARLGVIDGNPVREDIDEMGKMLDIHFILNVVLNEENRVVKAFAGHYLKAWEQGVKLTQSLSEISLEEKVDLVIASPGGYPKDMDLYQVQKGLAHAVRVLRPGGIVVLVGQCVSGIGDEVFFDIMREAKSPHEVISRFESQGFKMGLHKAFLWCRSLVQHKVYFYGDGIPSSAIEKFFLDPLSSLQQGISEALKELPPRCRIAIMPKASSTFVAG